MGDDAALTPSGILRDIIEGVKVGGFGILITVLALFANFIPFIGQMTVFLLYCCYSTLLFLDFAASRKRWSFRQKLDWIKKHRRTAFRIGVIPALVTMIPLINIFALALLSPFFTVHTTLNFAEIEMTERLEKERLIEESKQEKESYDGI